MPPPGVAVAESPQLPLSQSVEKLAELLKLYLEQHREGSVLEDGKVLFELLEAQHRVTTEGDRCTLQLWSAERNLVRTIQGAVERSGMLRLTTQRFGQPQPKTLVLTPGGERREPARREPARQRYLKLLQRVLHREFPEWTPDAFRAAMDLERSFGPAYARGSLIRGNEAWAVIGVGSGESQAMIDGVLTLGILWLHHCRERGDGRRHFRGLRVVVPHGAAQLTSARLAWLSAGAQWQVFELDEKEETLTECDPADQGNLRTRLLHHPDETTARERFAEAAAAVLSLVPRGEEHRVEQRLRSSAELAFLLHGLEFARARISLAAASFTHTLQITVGVGAGETPLGPGTQRELCALVADLFARRDARVSAGPRKLRPHVPGRGIGVFTGAPAHRRQFAAASAEAVPGRSMTFLDRLEERERVLSAQQDPLYRAAPERWLESVLRENLAPLTRSLAPQPSTVFTPQADFANDEEWDRRGNRSDAALDRDTSSWGRTLRPHPGQGSSERLIPRFDPRFVYTQVPAVAGAADRGMLDLLGRTEDGRLAVVELKASDDLQLPLQGLDYWIRVRHHHAAGMKSHGGSDLQAHGYFRDAELSPLPPRLFLVAPALQIHPATETILRYLSPQVEWTLLALDERWRQQIRVIWRKSGGASTRG